MEQIVNLHIEKLPEGFVLTTSDEIQGLVAQGRTVTETLEIARDVARRLLEAQGERQTQPVLETPANSFDYPLVIGGCVGQLAGFRYRDIVRRLKQFGFEFDRQAAGSHEIWYNAYQRYTTVPNHPGDVPEGTLRAISKQAGIAHSAFAQRT